MKQAVVSKTHCVFSCVSQESKIAVLEANALVISRLDYCNFLLRHLSSFNTCKLQCIQSTLARILQTFINSQGHLLLSKIIISCQSNFFAFSKWPPWRIGFSTVVIPAILVHFCLYVVVDMTQDTIIHIKGS